MKMSQLFYAHLHFECVYFLYDYIPFVFILTQSKRMFLGSNQHLGHSSCLWHLLWLHNIYIPNYHYYYVFLRYIESLYLYLVPPNILDEESSPSSVTIRENHNASLQCNAEGTPQPRITWRREDGKKIIIKKKKNAGKKG